MKQAKKLILIVFGILLLISCSGTQPEKEQNVLKTREVLNQMLQEYIAVKATFDLETQQKVRAIFYQMDRSLDLWELAVESGEDWTIHMDKFIQYKTELINTIGEVMGWTQK